jgi:hypothetical protein
MIAPGRRLRTIARDGPAGGLCRCWRPQNLSQNRPRVVCDGSVGAREGALPTHLRVRDGLRALTPARRLVPETRARLPARDDA